MTKPVLGGVALFCWSLLVICSGCYSFKGFTIDPGTTSFFVSNLENRAPLANPGLAQEFTEKLKLQLRNETRLNIRQDAPDLEFSGYIADYRVTSEAPNAQQGSALNRLTMVVHIDFNDNKTEKNNYSQDFQFFYNFSATETLAAVQDDLNRKLSTQIINDIILKTFNNW
jgi:hypothetical protein